MCNTISTINYIIYIRAVKCRNIDQKQEKHKETTLWVTCSTSGATEFQINCFDWRRQITTVIKQTNGVTLDTRIQQDMYLCNYKVSASKKLQKWKTTWNRTVREEMVTLSTMMNKIKRLVKTKVSEKFGARVVQEWECLEVMTLFSPIADEGTSGAFLCSKQ